MSPHSEASRMLEAALEQMDGIIQGAKFDANSNGGAFGAEIRKADPPKRGNKGHH